MKKKNQKYTASILCVLMIIGLIFSDVSLVEVEAASNPFAAMYDSDVKFLGDLKKFLPQEKMTDKTQKDNSQNIESPEQYEQPDKSAAEEGFEKDLDNLQKDKPKQQNLNNNKLDYGLVLQEMKSEKSDKLMGLPLSEEGRGLINNLYEKSRVNRFIVKYKSDDDKNSFKSKSKLLFKSNKKITLLKDNLEEIILQENVNPSEFAKTLISAGLDSKIEYIQPDFVFNFASLDTTYTEGESDGGPISENVLDSIRNETEPIDAGVNNNNDEDYLGSEETGSNYISLENEEEIIVALIDTGVDINHPDLAGRMVGGWNFVDDTETVYNSDNPVESTHGTHIAGVISNNSNENVKIMPLKVFGGREAYTSDIIAAINYAQEHGARIVNCSFGSSDMNPALQETISNSNMLFVASAGNARSDLSVAPVYPAAFSSDNIISVSSLNEDSGFSYYSNYSNTMVDIAARGRAVRSTLPENSYGLFSGTSVSAGFISAAAGELYAHMIEEEYQNLSLISTPSAINSVTDSAIKMLPKIKVDAYEVRSRVLTGADKLTNLQNKVVNGRRLNLSNSINDIEGEYLSTEVEDDFDVHSYNPTQSELYELYSLSGTPVKIAAGLNHALVLLSDGTVWTWGSGYNSFTQVIGLSNVVDISAGFYHSLALKVDGTVWKWEETSATKVPVQIGKGSVMFMSAGEFHSLIVYEETGDRSFSFVDQFGQFPTGEVPCLFDRVVLPQGCSAGSHSIIIAEDDMSVIVEGDTYTGALGNIPYKTNNNVGLANLFDITCGYIKQVESGHYQNFVLDDEDGSVWYWGRNLVNSSNNNSPVKINDLTNVNAISAGGNNGLGIWPESHPISTFLKNDGTVWEWSEIYSGQVNINNVEQVDVGGSYTIALKSDGTIWGWGDNCALGINQNIPIQLNGSPCNTTEQSLIVNITQNETFNFTITGADMNTVFNRKFTLEFDPTMVELCDLCTFTSEEEKTVINIISADINVVRCEIGRIEFFFTNNSIAQSEVWTGLINSLKFKSKTNSAITINLTIE